MLGFNCIVIATDFGETSSRALGLAIGLAEQYRSKLVIAHCFEVPSYVYAGALQSPVDLLSPIQQAAKSQLDDVVETTRARHADTLGELRMGVVADELLDIVAKHKAGLVVVGTHGRTGVAHLVLGSVAEKIVRTSHVPVITVPNK
jgi:nucleotide-binding universal stress UspA family protein